MKNVSLKLIVVEPVTGLNLGFIARLCKNFEVDSLYIVNPKLSKEEWEKAQIYSAHAQDILNNAIISTSLEESLIDVDFSVATSAIYRLKGGNILRRPITLSELRRIVVEGGIRKLGVVLGRETTGLTKEEIRKCDTLLTIESSKKYPTLNISHAAAIILHYIYNNIAGGVIERHYAPPEVKSKIIEFANKVIEKIINDEGERERILLSLKNVIARGYPDYREAGLLLKLFKNIERRIR